LSIKKSININNRSLFTKSGLQIARSFVRVIVGKRGMYLEINEMQIIKENIKIPKKEEWRIDDVRVYYIEYRTKDSSNVKVYFQKRIVRYADYQVGMYYVYWKDVDYKFEKQTKQKRLDEMIFGKKDRSENE